MKMNLIRKKFVEYYERLGYQSLPRASLLDPSIPMSYVMSAGLVQVETSLASVKERHGNQYVLVQDCFRHFDLEDVGLDGIHLSLFEMPGAFIFGPDGKAETIHRMWDLTTSILGINKEKIWVSYYKGGKIDQTYVPEDLVTRQTWLEIGIPESHLIGLGVGHNYWIQGNGFSNPGTLKKCGPNTELFYDLREDKPCGVNCLPGCKCGRFVEFSNTLFISHQLDRQTCLILPLADPFTETVIGSERVAMILQDAPSVFEIDIFLPLFAVVDDFVTSKNLSDFTILASKRIIVDYLRSFSFLVADGAPPPGKDGRQRIIKLLIRGIITRQMILGIESPDFLPLLIDRIFEASKTKTWDDWVKFRLISYFETERRRYLRTLVRGFSHLDQLLNKNQGLTLSGYQIAYLEKKTGFPHILTQIELMKKGLPFKEAEYAQALEEYIPQIVN